MWQHINREIRKSLISFIVNIFYIETPNYLILSCVWTVELLKKKKSLFTSYWFSLTNIDMPRKLLEPE